jgi:membrane protease YdiL (CAAX protease family)
MKDSFLKIADQGQNAAWRYLCGMLFAMSCGYIGFQWVGIPVAEAIAGFLEVYQNALRPPKLEENINSIDLHSLEISYIAIHFAYAFFVIGICLAVKVLHQRPVLTLISPNASFLWPRFRLGFSLWFGLASLQSGIEFLLQPSPFTWNFQPADWLTFLPLALVLTPIQTSAEELLFRGYLLQGLGLMVRQPLALTLIASLPFAIAHWGNPEMLRGAEWIGLTYLIMAIFLTVITLQDNRLELALGVHAANNLFIVLVVNTPDSALPSPALLLQQTPADPRFTLASLLVAIAIFYGWVFGRRQRANGSRE